MLENDVRVGSPHAGGHHSGSSGTLAGPFLKLGVYLERRAGKINFRIGLAEVETRRKFAVLEGKDRLYDAGDCGSGVEMAYVRFCGTDRAVA